MLPSSRRSHGRAAAPWLGRWEPIEVLSYGDDAAVVLARDLEHDGRTCALKLFRAPSWEALEKSRRELNVLRQLHHPAVVEVYDFGAVSDAPPLELHRLPWSQGEKEKSATRHDTQRLSPTAYVAYAYFTGRTLRDAFIDLFPELVGRGTLAPDAASSEQRWRSLLESIAKITLGLDYLHGHGLIHYDIKPENLLLAPGRRSTAPHAAGDPPSGDVKIIDFGLCERETTPLGTRARGTVPYIAPEILRDGRADRRSDLYSLGVSLVVAMCGRAPFRGSSAKEWLRAAVEGTVLDVAEMCPAAPEGLVRLIKRLIAPDPAERPADALEVYRELARLGEFAAALGQRAPLRPVPAVGWERELQLLTGEVERLRRADSTTSIVVLDSTSGQFASAFVAEIEALARTQGVDFVRGCCASPRSFPYQPFAEIVTKLCRRLDLSQPPWQRFRPALRLLAPIDAPRHKVAQGPPEPAFDAGLFVDWVTDFFLEVGRNQPTVLCLEDFRQADAACISLLRSLARSLAIERQEQGEDLARQPRGPSRLLIVTAFDGTDAERPAEDAQPASQAVQDLCGEPYTLRLRLRPLSLEQIQEWVDARQPSIRLSPRLLNKIYKKTAGAPRFVDECLRRLQALPAFGPPEPAGISTTEGGAGDDHAAADVISHLPPRCADAQLERSRSLPPALRAALEILAAACAAPMSLSEAAEVCRQVLADPEIGTLGAAGAAGGEVESQARSDAAAERLGRGALDPIRDLETEGFLEIRNGAQGAEVFWSDPATRVLVYRQIPPDRQALYHRHLCAHVEIDAVDPAAPAAPEAIARHALAAGRIDLFVRYALLAADRLLATRSSDEAARLYEAVLAETGAAASANSPSVENADALRWELNSKLVSIYRQLQLRTRALERLTILLSLREEERQPWELASLYRQMGEIYLENADATNAAFFLDKSIEAARGSRTASTPSRRRRDSVPAPPGAAAVELSRALLSRARCALETGDAERARERLEECLSHLSKIGGNATLSITTRVLLAQVELRRNAVERALVLLRQALDDAESNGEPAGLLEAMSALGNAYLSQGNQDKAIECFLRAARVADACSNKQELARCHSSLGTVYHNRGDHHRALECYQQSLWLSRKIGDLRGIANSYNNLGNVHRLRDELERAGESYRLAIDLFAKNSDQLGMAAGMNNLSGILEQEGKYNEALEFAYQALEKRKRLNARSGIAFSYYRVGRIYRSKGEIDKATDYAERSFALRTELGDKMGLAYSHLQIGELHLSQAKYYDAFQHCQSGLELFQAMENQIGQLWARELTGHVLGEVGLFAQAHAVLEQVEAEARDQEQKDVLAECLLRLSSLAAEEGNLNEAETQALAAHRLLRASRNRRQLVEALLQESAVMIELGHTDQASGQLEEAYSLLEELGIRDLVPLYFLLRGRVDLEAPEPNLNAVRKVLQRGLTESREIHLPECRWRLHAAIALLEKEHGDPHLARIHVAEAREILSEIHAGLPRHFQEHFYKLREREAIVRLTIDPPAHASTSVEKPGAASEPAADGASARISAEHLNREVLHIHQLAAAVASEGRFHRLLEQMLDSILALVNAERGFLILKPRGTGEERTTVARNLDREELGAPGEKMSQSIALDVLRTGKAVVSGNALSEERFHGFRSVHELRLRSLACMPLRTGEEILGVLYLDNRHRRNAFQEEDLWLLERFCAQGATAITTARLLEEKEEINLKLRNRLHRRTAQIALSNADAVGREEALAERFQLENIAGRSSRAMREFLDLVRRASTTELPVLVEGDSGTGKELVARALHFSGPHRRGRFVAESCASLADGLLESELFGHVKGAFTGATEDKPGLFEQAHNGTLFLDDASEMSPLLQQKLLRVIEQGAVRPVGGKETRQVHVRIVCASNRSLEALVREGHFRQDLYFRINCFHLRMPPLRDRREDIPELVQHFVKGLREREAAVTAYGFSADALGILAAAEWTGNVRELRSVVERALLLAQGKLVQVDEVERARATQHRSTAGGAPSASAEPARDGASIQPSSYRQARARFEKSYVEMVLKATAGRVAQAARLTGLSRESLYRLVRKHSVERPPLDS